MQLFLLVLTTLFAVILYKMLNKRGNSYPYIRTVVKYFRRDEMAYDTTEMEEGTITIDESTVMIDGEKYFLKDKFSKRTNAWLYVKDERLISVRIQMDDEEKYYHIDPAHNLYREEDPKEYKNESLIHIA